MKLAFRKYVSPCFFASLILTILLCSACAPAATPTNPPPPPPTDTVVPTIAPSPTPEPTVVPSPKPTLSVEQIMQKWAKEYVEKMKITLPAYDAWKAGPLKEWEETLNKEVQGTTYRAMLEACFEWVNTNQKPCLENESMKELAVLIPIAEKVVADAEPLIAPFSEHRPGDIVVSEVCEPWGALPIMINNFNKIIAMVRDGEVNFGATTSPQNIDKCVDQIREYVKNYKEP